MHNLITKNNFKSILLIIFIITPVILYFISKSDLNYCDVKKYYYDTQTYHVSNIDECPTLNKIVKTYFYPKPDLNNIHINISDESLRKIFTDIKKARAIKQNNGGLSWTPAEILFDNKRYKVDIKLHGYLEDHWDTNYRFSLKVKIKNNKHILGLKRFTIMKPWSRSVKHTKVFELLNKNLGIKYREIEYVDVSLNASKWGLMILEPRIDNSWLEYSGYSSGPTVKLHNVSRLIDYSIIDPNKTSPTTSDHLSSPDIEFQNNKVKNTARYDLLHHLSLIHSKKNIDLINILDFNSFAALLVSSLTYGDMHSIYQRNILFYLNPITNLIEPIPGDQTAATGFKTDLIFNNMGFPRPKHSTATLVEFPFYYYLKDYPLFWQYVDINLKKINKYIRLMKENDNHQTCKFRDCFQGYFNDKSWPVMTKETIREYLSSIKNYNISPVKKLTNCSKDDSIKRPIVLLKSNDDTILFKNYTQRFIETLVTIKIIDNNGMLRTDRQRLIFKPHDYNQISLKKAGNEKIFKISYRSDDIGMLVSTSKLYPLSSHYYSCFGYIEHIPKDYLENGRHERFFKAKQESFKTHSVIPSITKLSGDININSVIYVGLNNKLIIEAGSIISMQKGGVLYIDGGSVEMRGTYEKPIIIKGNNKGSVFIKNSDNVILSHVKINSLTICCGDNSWTTGSFTLYKSNAKLEYVDFLDHDIEDTLHVAESKIYGNNISFINSYSDGFDSDNSKVTLINVSAKNINGDGFDFFKSNATVENFTLSNIFDKGFSVGENSKVHLNNGNITSASVGFASKDGSTLTLNNVHCFENRYACILGYKKKHGYDKSEVIITNSKLEGKIYYTKNSSVRGANNSVKVKEKKISQLYRDSFMKKK